MTPMKLAHVCLKGSHCHTKSVLSDPVVFACFILHSG